MADFTNNTNTNTNTNAIEENKNNIQSLQQGVKDIPSVDTASIQKVFNQEQETFENKRLEEKNAGPNNTPSFWSTVKEKAGIENNNTQISDEDWNTLRNGVLYKAQNGSLEDAEEEAYKQAGAIELSRKFNISPKEAYTYLDGYCSENWGDKFNSYKGKYKAIKDSFTLGQNTLDLSKLGKDLSYCEAVGDTEKAQKIMGDIQALEEYNNTLQDSMPRGFWMKALEAGAQTLPYTAAIALPSVVTGVFAPGLAPLVGFASGENITYGTEYIQLRKDGCSEDVARGVATASSAVQSVIEQALGTISNTVSSAVLNSTGKALKNTVVDKGIDYLSKEIGSKVFSKFHFGDKTFTALAKGLMEYGKNITEEGAEEFLQNMTSWTSEKIAQALSESDMEVSGLEDALKDSWEQFKGGVLGAVVLGIPDAGLNARATARDFINVRDTAIESGSKEAFVKQMQKAAEEKSGVGSSVFEGMSEEKIKEDAEQIYNNFASERTKAADEKAKELEEVITGQEGTEEISEGEASTEEIKAEARNEKGGLIIQNTINDTGDKGTYRAGDNTQKSNNVYGYINYSLDNENNTVEIDSFKMTGNREYLRNELFEKFAEDFAGYDIKWSPNLKAAQDIKENLINRNPRGRDAGLNYFESQEKAADTKVKLEVSNQIKKYMPSLSEKERSAAVALLEAGANGLGYNLKDYVAKTFNNGVIFGDKARLEEAEQTAQDITKGATIKGAADIKEFTDGVRAVIYAGEKADFSTWCHELSHVWRRQLTGDLLKNAETAFNVKDGKWTRDNEEDFARSFEKYLYTGKAETNELKELFEKLKDFMRRVYSYMTGDLNDDVKKVFDELFNGPAKEQVEASTETKQTEAEAKAEARIEDENSLTPQQKAFLELANEIEPDSMDATKAKTFTSGEDIKWYFEEKDTAGFNDRINDVITMKNENEKIEESIIKDPDASTGDKTEAALDMSGEKFVDSLNEQFDIFQTDTNGLLFQAVGVNDETKNNDALIKAKKMLEEGKSAYQIKRETGYQLDDNSHVWLKEIEDFRPSEKITSLIMKAISGGKIGRRPLEIGTLNGVMGKDSNLFKMYPALRDTKVNLVKMAELPFNTLFLGRTNNLIININGIESSGVKGIDATLARGVQNAINNIEGISNNLTEEDEKILLGIGDEMIKRGLTDQDSINIAKDKLQELITRYKNSQDNIVSRINQIRSTMTESARKASLFEGNNTPLLFQVAGEKGAAILDKFNDTHERIDNLNIARQMEASGASAKNIKLATGWERGADTKWRYEINDDVKHSTEDYQPVYAVYKLYPKLRELEEKIINHYENGGEPLSTEEAKEYDSLGDFRNEYVRQFIDYDDKGNATWIKPARLYDVIDAPELFTAYPSLKDVNFIIKDIGVGVEGNYNRKTRTITLSPIAARNEDSVLLHEIQHIIQNEEGFASGGNVKSIDGIQLAKDINKEYEEKRNNIKNSETYKEAYEKALNEYGKDKRGAGYYAEQEAFKAVGYDDVKEDAEREKRIKYLTNPYNTYKAISGEVEARNIEKRYTMTPQERLNTLLSDTEDVRREDQIILYDSLSAECAYNSSDELKEEVLTQSEKDNVRSQYENTDKWMKAPNGEDTNLSEDQWLQVRTPSFKAWFGDWENEPEKASKIVDDNGEPLVVYHATNKDFDIFDLEKLGEVTDRNASDSLIKATSHVGFWFSKDSVSEDMGTDSNKTKAVYLNIKDYYGPLSIGRLSNEIANNADYNEDEDNFNYKEAGENYREYLKFKGCDGILIDDEEFNTDSFIVFDPKNIKSATDNSGAFSSDNDSIYFQTESELMEEAARFTSWQEFMEFYTSWAAPDDAAVPEGADALWFQETWEKARKISPTTLEEMQRKNEEERKASDEDNTPEVKDAMFTAHLKAEPGMLEAFLKKINEIRHASYIEDMQDEEELEYNNKLEGLKNFIEQRLSHVSILSNAQKIGNGGALTDRAKQQLISMMSNGGKVRDYRAAYSYIMDDDTFKVDEKDSVEAQIEAQAKKYGLEDMAVNISTLSAEKRAQLADKIENERIKTQLKDGTLKVSADFDSYIKHIKSIMDENDQKLKDLEEKTKEDYKHLSDKEYRDILDVYDRLLIARNKYKPNKDTVARHADAAAKVGERYKTGFYRNAEATYNSLYRQYADLMQLVTSTAELEKAINRRENKYNLQQENKARKAELDAVKAIKELRKRLIKRAVRKVDFSRISYDDARLIIAAQRIFMPNLEGGVNTFLGTDKAWARQMWSDYYTDEDNRLKIRAMLTRKGTKTALSALKILEKTKSEEDFNSMSSAEKRILYRAMPKENWKNELELEKLDKENEDSIQLPIEFKEITRTTKDARGKKHNEVSYTPIVQEALALQLRDTKNALGDELYSLITSKPFEEWTTEELERYVKKIDEMYVRGRDKLAAKKEAEKRSAEEIRNRIKDAVQNTGIVINPDDSPEVKERKQEKINKILGMATQLKGTAADKTQRLSLLNKVIHGYFDANVRRVARILDNQKEGINTSLLYWEENEAYNTQERNKEQRINKIEAAMKASGITVEDLYKTVELDVSYRNAVDGEVIGGKKKLTIDEILYYMIADKDDQSRAAVRYGCMLDMKDRERFFKLNEKFDKAEESRREKLNKAVENGDDIEIAKNSLKPDMEEVDGHQVKPGTAYYVRVCNVMFENILSYANANLSRKYHDFVKAIQDDYAENYERLSKVCIDTFNQPLARVDNYVPLVRLSLSGDTNENRVKADLLAMTAEAGNQAGVDKGFTQKRTYISPINQMPVEAGLYKTWANSVDRNEHFIAYADYVRTLRRIYTGRDAVSTMQWIEGRYGHGMKNYIQDYINELANPDRAEPSESWEQAVRALRGRTAPAYLSWKLSSILKQAVTSPAPFMQFMTPLEYVSSCLQIIKHPKLMNEAIKEKSVFMKNRRYDPIVDVINEQVEKANSPVSAAWRSLQAKGMSGLEWIDWACVAPGWLRLYQRKLTEVKAREEKKYQAQKAKLTEEMKNTPMWEESLTDQQIETQARKGVLENDEIEKEAVNYADDCIRLCQPSDRKTDLSPLFKNGSELQRAFLQFTTSLNVIWQNIRYDLPYAVKNKMFKEAAGIIAGYTLAGVGLGLLAGDAPDGDDTDDEKKKKVKRLIFDSTTQFTDAVPLIGAAVTSASEKAITGEGMYRNSVDLFPTLTKAVQGTLNAVNGDWSKAFEKYAETVGMYIGAPVSGTKEALYAAGIGDKEEGINFKPEAFLGQRE